MLRKNELFCWIRLHSSSLKTSEKQVELDISTCLPFFGPTIEVFAFSLSTLPTHCFQFKGSCSFFVNAVPGFVVLGAHGKAQTMESKPLLCCGYRPVDPKFGLEGALLVKPQLLCRGHWFLSVPSIIQTTIGLVYKVVCPIPTGFEKEHIWSYLDIKWQEQWIMGVGLVLRCSSPPQKKNWWKVATCRS